MVNEMIIAILVIVIFVATSYIVKQKAKGTKCIGCPNSGACSKCHCDENMESQKLN